jgi:hypothetical protein
MGIYWGIFILINQSINQSPQKLKEILVKNGKKEDEFITINIDETMTSEGI